MSGIRITYSGLISFITGLVSASTGLIFTLIVTRTLTMNEYGTWGLINGILGYIIVFEPVISYWATREIARGIESGKTAILSSGVLSIGGIAVYVVIGYFIGLQTNVNTGAIGFAVILIPVIFLNRTLTAVSLAWKPHTVSYGTLSFGGATIPIGLIFVYILQMGLKGVILTNFFASLVSIIVLIIFSKDKIRKEIKKEFLKKWLRLFWVPIYSSIGSMMYFLDVLVFSVITKSVEGIALWSAAMVIPNLITHSGLISRAVYPKLLGENNTMYLRENLTHFFYFAIPLTTLTITFARSALFALNPIYADASIVVLFTSIFIFLNTITGIFQSFLSGMEKVDMTEKSTFRDYIRSKLFFLPTLTLIQYSLYPGLLAVGLLILTLTPHSQLDLVIFWSVIAVGTHFPFTIYLYILIRRNFKLGLEKASILRYLVSSIGIFGLIYVVTEKSLVYHKNILEFIPNLLVFVALGIGGYLAITYVIDKRTRNLFNAVLNEVKEKISH